MKAKLYIIKLLVLFLASEITVYSQEHPASSVQHSHAGNHTTLPAQGVAIFSGYGYIQGTIGENGNSRPKIIPVLGFDYFYCFNHEIDLVWQNDIELSSHSIEEDHQNYINRNYAILISAVIIYELFHNWAFFAGPGYDIETHHNFPVFRIGAEYGIRFEG